MHKENVSFPPGEAYIPLGTGAPLCYFAFGDRSLPRNPHLEWWVEVWYIGRSVDTEPPVMFSVLKTISGPEPDGARKWEFSFNPPYYNGEVSRIMFAHGIGLGDIKSALEEEAARRFLNINGDAPSPAKSGSASS